MRLVSVGNVIVDLTIDIPVLPEKGGDVVGRATGTTPGGSLNTMVAAVRQGLPTAYAGAHGTGPFGDRVRAALAAEGVEVLQPPTLGVDTGYDIALTESDGERTFVTVFGAEASLTADALAGIRLGEGDLVHVSGYGLLASTNGEAIARWLESVPPGHVVLVDPGPLVSDIPPSVWAAAEARADWISCNLREARLMTGEPGPAVAAEALARRGNVVVRLGADGCLVGVGGQVSHVPGFAVTVVDTNGAGDAHAGAFLAALARGADPIAAARAANACAAIAITRPGPGTAPTLEEVLQLLA